jgi:mono/diheme cytochrome c family protein
MRFRDFVFAVIGMLVLVSLAQAQQLTDRQKGRILAREVCAQCHAVGRQRLRSPNSEAPAFVSVASTPGMTEMALNVFFLTSHRAMPNIILTPDQRTEIIAYILSLKR